MTERTRRRTVSLTRFRRELKEEGREGRPVRVEAGRRGQDAALGQTRGRGQRCGPPGTRLRKKLKIISLIIGMESLAFPIGKHEVKPELPDPDLV